MGRSLALELGKSSSKNELAVGNNNNEKKKKRSGMLTCRLDFTPSIPSVLPDESSNFLHGFRHKSFYSGEIRGMEYLMALRERSGIYIKKSIRLAMIYSY